MWVLIRSSSARHFSLVPTTIFYGKSYHQLLLLNKSSDSRPTIISFSSKSCYVTSQLVNIIFMHHRKRLGSNLFFFFFFLFFFFFFFCSKNGLLTVFSTSYCWVTEKHAGYNKLVKKMTTAIALNKALFSTKKNVIFFFFFFFPISSQKCGYSLEAPLQGASNDYPQHMFSLRNKNKYLPDTHLI